MAPTHVELYEALKPSIGEEAAAMIANVVPSAGNLATKEDVLTIREEFATFRGEMRAEFATFRGEMREEFASFRGEMHGEIRAGDIRTIKWIVGVFAPILVGTWGTLVAALLQ